MTNTECDGMYYLGEYKKYCGKISATEYYSSQGAKADTFGYYQEPNGLWTVFITGDEDRTEIRHYRCNTEAIAVKKINSLVDMYNFSYEKNNVIKHLADKENVVVGHLMFTYGYSLLKAKKTFRFLMQDTQIMFEFVYYIENGDFVPDKYANTRFDFTVKELSKGVSSSVLAAFLCMVSLKINPSVELEQIQKERCKKRKTQRRTTKSCG